MNVYAEQPSVRNRQMVTDALVVAWCVLWVWLGRNIFLFVDKLGGIGRTLQDTSSDIDNGVGGLPSIARSIGAPLSSIGNAFQSAGDTQVAIAHDLAVFVAVFIALLFTVPVVARHLIKRVVWMRKVKAIKVLRRSPNFDRLIAQRALLSQPLYKLAAVSDDPIDDVHSGRTEKLVELELEEVGMLPRAR